MAEAVSSTGLAELRCWARGRLGGRCSERVIEGTASDRRYVRFCGTEGSLVGYVVLGGGAGGVIADHVRVTQAFRAGGVRTPRILESSCQALLMEDAGESTLATRYRGGVPEAQLQRVLEMRGQLAQVDLPPSGYDRHPSRVWREATAAGIDPAWRSAMLAIERLVDAMPTTVQHGDLHARNVVVSEGDQLSLVDVQDAGLGPYALDVALLAVDPNYDEVVMSADTAARELARYPVTAGRDVRRDAVAAMAFQCFWLVGVCHRLFEAGRGEQFRNESRAAIGKLERILPLFETR